MKRVLLTGASGFLGRHCLPPLLAKGYEIDAVSLNAKISEVQPGVRWHQVDLLDAKQVSELFSRVSPTHLLHLAWYAVPGKYWTSVENLRWVEASLNLLRLFKESGGERVTMAGTCAEYDWCEGRCSEQTTTLAPATLYGTCKHALQLMLAAYARGNNLSASWARIFFLFGPYEYSQRVVAQVISSLLRNKATPCSHGEQQRDFLFVEDAADAVVALLDSPVEGPVNIGSGEPVSLKEVISKIGKKLDRPSLLEFGGIADRPEEPAILFAQVERLRNEVGWSPRHDLDRGLDKTIAWWKRELSQP